MDEILEGKNSKYLPADTTVYNIDVNDDFIYVNTSLNPVTIYLPSIKGSGLDFLPKRFYISDYTGNASTNNITILATVDELNSGNPVSIQNAYGTAIAEIAGLTEWYVTADGTSGVVGGANNGLSVSGTNIQWGGSLIKNTAVTQAGYSYDQYGASPIGTYYGLSNSPSPMGITGGYGMMNYQSDALTYAASSNGNYFHNTPSYAKIYAWNTNDPTSPVGSGTPANYSNGFFSPTFISFGISGDSGTTEYTLSSDTSNGLMYGISGGSTYFRVSTEGVVTITPKVVTTGTNQTLVSTSALNTGQTASTEINNYAIITTGRQWLTGPITTQREFRLTGPNYSFVGASTIQNAFTLYVSAPVAGTNATIVNNYAAGFLGNISVSGSIVLTGFTAGSVLFAGTSGTITQDNANFYWDDTNNRLGLGKAASPAASFLSIGAGTTAQSQINLAVGVAPTTPVNGDYYYSSTTGLTSFLNNNAIPHTSFTSGATNFGIYLDNSLPTVPVGIGTYTNHHWGLYANFGANVLNVTTTNRISIGKSSYASLNLPASLLELRPQSTSIANSVFGIRNNADTGTLFLVNDLGNLTVSPQLSTTGAVTGFTFTGAANTGQTLSTEINRSLWTSGSRQWATGAIATQREHYWTAPTYSFVGASTITDAFTGYFTAPIAGTNATITNAWAIGTTGYILVNADTATIKLQSRVGLTSNAAIYMNAATPSSTNYTINANTSDSYFNAQGSISSNLHLQVSGNDRLAINGTTATLNRYYFTPASVSSITASTELNSLLYESATQSWSSGTLATQRFIYFKSQTISFASSSTATEAYGMYVEASTAGTNATITNNFALGLLAGTATIKIGNVTGSTTEPAIYLNQATPSTTNYTFWQSGGSFQINSASGILTRIANATQQSVTATNQTFTPGAASSGSTAPFTFTNPNSTGLTASTEVQITNWTTGTTTHATGAITTQRDHFWRGTIHAFAGASTITNLYTGFFEAAAAGANATITKNWALGTSGDVNFLVGGTTDGIKFQGLVGTLTTSAIYLNQAAPSASNYGISGTSSTISVNANGGNLILSQQIVPIYTIASTGISAFGGFANSSGALTQYTFTVAANTNQTLSTEISGFKIIGGGRQWATGAITTQREFYQSSVNYSFVGASTISEAFGHYIEAPTAGTNATITNNFALGLLSGTGSMKFGNITGSTSRTAIYLEQATPSSSNFTLSSNGSGVTILNAVTSTFFSIGGGNRASLTSTDTSFVNHQQIAFTPNATNSGSVVALTYTQASNTGQTASTELPFTKWTGSSRAWATGAITTQREHYWSATTYTAAGASVITNAYGNYIEAPVAGANVSITNNWAIGTNGSSSFGATSSSNIHRFYAGTSTGFAQLWAVSSTYICLHVGASSPTSSNYAVASNDGNTIYFNGGTNANLGVNDIARLTVTGVTSSGATNAFVFSPASCTNQTSTSEAVGYLYNSYSRQWATGAIATQREQYVKTVTYTAVGSSTITNAYSLYLEAPTAGANITITNNWSLGVSGNAAFSASVYIGSLTTSAATSFLTIAASTTSKSAINLIQGAAPSAPVDGDIWREDNTNTGLKIRVNGVTKTITLS